MRARGTGFISTSVGGHPKSVKRGLIQSDEGFDEMALERGRVDRGSKAGRSASRREVVEPEREERAAAIREAAGLGFAGLELEAETTGITGGLGHSGKRRIGNDSGWRMTPEARELPWGGCRLREGGDGWDSDTVDGTYQGWDVHIGHISEDVKGSPWKSLKT